MISDPIQGVERDHENPNAESGKEYVYTIDHEVNVVNLRKENSQGLGPKNP